MNLQKSIKCGELTVTNGSIDVTDPCYDKENEEKKIRFSLPIQNGKYDCLFTRKDQRVSSCSIVLNGVDESKLVNEWTVVDTIFVDSGLAGFFIDKPDYTDKEWKSLCNELADKDKKSSRDLHGVYMRKDAFFTSSGLGDGQYEVFISLRDDKIVAVKIQFID